MLESLKHEDLQFQELTPEEKEKRGILARLTGPIASFTKGTRNGRKYSDKLWEKAFDSPLVKEMFKNGGLPGELQHPADRSETDPTKIAIMMPEPPKKDSKGHLVASVDILDTPCGQIAYQLGKYGFKFGISSRGEGDLIQDFSGEESVDPDTYTLNAFDLVLIPACEDARLQFNESLNTKKSNKLRTILGEALENASDVDRKIMEEALDELNIDDNWRFVETYQDEDIYYDPSTKKYIVGELDSYTILNSLKNAKEYIDRFNPDVLTEEQVGREETKPNEMGSTILQNKPQNEPEENQEVSVNITNDIDSQDKTSEDESESETVVVNNTEEDKEELDEALSPQEKMDAWHAGDRRENIKACGEEKLRYYLDICENSGYKKEVQIILNELKRRGAPIPIQYKSNKSSSNKSAITTIEKKPTAKMHNGDLYIRCDEPGRELMKKHVANIDMTPKGMLNGDLYYITTRADFYSNDLAADLMRILKEDLITEDLQEFCNSCIKEDVYDGMNERAPWDTDFHRLDIAYNHNFKQFKDREKESGMIQDFVDDLDAFGKEYDIYEHTTDPGITIFFQESLNESCDGWIAFYNGKKLEITKNEADSLYDAKQKAIKELKVPKSKMGLLAIKPAYNESLNEAISWDELNGTEQSAAEAALANIKNGSKLEDAVHGAVTMYNDANSEEEYEDEEFYGEEADYTKVLDYVKQSQGLTEDIENDVEFAADSDGAIVEQLQNILKHNKALESKIKVLQEKLSVGYAKEMELKEELDTYKQKVSALSKKTKEIKVLTEKLSKAEKMLNDNKAQAEGKISTLNESIQSKESDNKDLKKDISLLNEAVDKKNSKIRSLNEQISEYKDQLSSKDNDIEQLKEKYETGQKTLEQVKENYSKKLEQQNQIIEKYRRVAKNSVKRYIESQAIRLGVKSDEIVNRLPKNYSFSDVDKICEDLQEYKFNMSNLPFNSQVLNENIKINAKNINNGLIEANPDDEITDYDLKVAEAFL